MKYRMAKGLKREEGIYLPIFAVLGTSIIAFIFLISVNTLLLRRTSSIFRDLTESICYAVSLSDDFENVEGVVDGFALAVKDIFAPNNLPDYLRFNSSFALVEAKIVIPTMTQGKDFSIVPSSEDPVKKGDHSITSLGLTDCVHASSGCSFRGSVYPKGASPFPGYLMEENAGTYNTFGCEFKATTEVYNLFGVFDGANDGVDGTTAEFQAQYVYSRPVDGRFPDYLPSDTAAGFDQVSDRPGLVIAVSTHLQTYPQLDTNADSIPDVDSQFIFDESQADYSPVNGVTANNSTEFQSLLPGDFTSGTGTPAYVIPERNPGTVLSGVQPLPITPFAGSFFVNSSPAYEMAVACMNPVVLARNAFLAAIVQLASRSGYLRASTEILHIGTEHRAYSDADYSPFPRTAGTYNSDWSPLMDNPPVIMVPFGNDLLRPPGGRSYQLPYIFYHSGGGPANGNWSSISPSSNATDAYRASEGFSANGPQGLHPVYPTLFGYTYFGRINPWVDDAGSGGSHPGWRSFHSLIANQLRICAHFYQNVTATSPGVEAPQAPLYSSAFEPNEMYDDGTISTPVFQSGFTQSDQKCAFSSETGCSALTAENRSAWSSDFYANEAGVDAVSLVSMLGTTQSCPATVPITDNWVSGTSLLDQDGDGAVDAGAVCVKPVEDLKPDFLGLVKYLNDELGGVVSPGLHPIGVEGTVAEPFGISGSVSTDTANIYTPVLIVTHQAPTPSQVSELRTYISGAAWQERKIIVVFIPADDTELARVGSLRSAFRAQFDKDADDAGSCSGECDLDRDFANIVIMVDPRNPDNLGTHDYCAGDGCSAAELRLFFQHFTKGTMSLENTDFGQLSAVDFAKKVFSQEIVKTPERKL